MSAFVDRSAFLSAMSVMPGPVTLVTTIGGGGKMGLTVSAVCSLSADPPSVVACVNKSASAHDAFEAAGCFGVNILRPGQQDLASLFTRKEVDRFAGRSWTCLSTGAPILQDALVAFDCSIDRIVDGYSHSLLIGLVREVRWSEEDAADCLIWHHRRYRKSHEL
jgi:flavin reductase